MARVVKLGDRSPLILKVKEIPGPVVAVCRCGLSAAWPLCDGSHAATRDEAEGALYAYGRNEEGKLDRREIEVEHPGKTQVSSADQAYG